MDNEFMENAAPEENTQPVAPAPKTKSVQAKPKLNKKVLIPIIAGVAVVAVVLAIVLFAGGDGNYMAPLDLQIDVLNAKTYDKYIEATAKASNGLLDDAMEDCFDVLQKTDLMEYMKAFYEENVASFEDEYGKDYKFYYETEDLEKIVKDELNNAK